MSDGNLISFYKVVIAIRYMTLSHLDLWAMEPTLQNTGIGRMLQKGDEPKVGEDVLFRWKTKEEAEITQICKNLL